MDQRQRTNRFGICMILWALAIRLIPPGIFLPPDPKYSETGRDVRFSVSVPHVRESPGPWLPEPERPRFGAEDARNLLLANETGFSPDLAELMTRPLDWDLRGEEPAVLILHTHATESYTKAGENYAESARYRTLEADYNMVSLGDAVVQELNAAGIPVVHDRQFHDYPSYNGAYVQARKAVAEYLERYPSIRLVLDLHRDASADSRGQLRTEAMVDGETAARLMLVVGTNATRLSHKNWQENLALALKLQVQLERLAPGITRPVNLRTQRFNQDLSPGALIVEVGAAGNTRQEALRAARVLAEAVAALAGGADTPEA